MANSFFSRFPETTAAGSASDRLMRVHWHFVEHVADQRAWSHWHCSQDKKALHARRSKVNRKHILVAKDLLSVLQ
jgi:hypothetical protein